MEREVFMMANEEKMEQKQEGRKHNLKVFVIMIPLLIVSLLGLIVFSRENFKESVKEYFAVKYLESNEKLVFRNKNRNKYCSYKLDKNGNIKVKVKFDKLYKDEYANRIDLCVKFKPNSERYKMDLTDYPGKIYSYHTMFTKANEFYIKIYGIDYNPTEQEKLKAGTYTINVTGDVEIEDVAISKIETSFGSMYDTGLLLEMEKLHLVWQEKTGRELRSPSHHIHTRMHSSTLCMIMDSKLHSWSASGIIHLKN